MLERLSHNQHEIDETRAFFSREVEEVASNLTAQRIVVEGTEYTISSVEAYREANATSAWQKRIPEIKKLHPAETITYQSRSGQLTFIKAGKGADNIMIRELQTVEKDTKTKNPTAVTRLLGLQPGMKGKLVYLPEQNLFRFEK